MPTDRLEETLITAEQGDSIDIELGPVDVYDERLKTTTHIDLTQAGMKMWVTVKIARSDTYANAVVKKTAGVAGGAGGIDLNFPVSTDKNLATAHISPAESQALSVRGYYWDAQLEEPSGRKTTISRGTLRIAEDVTDA
jgi:hypothetical protein